MMMKTRAAAKAAKNERERAQQIARELNRRLIVGEDVNYDPHGRDEPYFESETYCRGILRRYAKSWIASGYKVSQWKDKVTLEKAMNKSVRELGQFRDGRPYETGTWVVPCDSEPEPSLEEKKWIGYIAASE